MVRSGRAGVILTAPNFDPDFPVLGGRQRFFPGDVFFSVVKKPKFMGLPQIVQVELGPYALWLFVPMTTTYHPRFSLIGSLLDFLEPRKCWVRKVRF